MNVRGGTRLAMTGELQRPHDQWVRATRRQPDHERALVYAPEAAERLLGRARYDIDAQVEQHQ